MDDAERARAYRALAAIEASAESVDGYVAATVGARGDLRALYLDPRAYRDGDADALAAAIVRAVADATRAAAHEAVAAAAVLLGPDADPDECDLSFDPALRELDRLIAASPRS